MKKKDKDIKAIIYPEANKTEKANLEKHKPSFAKKQSYQRHKKFNYDIKRSKNDTQKQVTLETNSGINTSKEEIKRPGKSLRHFIIQKCKWVILLVVSYVIIVGAAVTTPIIVNHFRIRSQNETKQERSIT